MKTHTQIPLFSTGHSDEVETVALSVLRSGQIASGAYVEAFRNALGNAIGNQNVITTSDMTAAMTIALRLSGVGPGDEVIASPFACMSTNAPLALSGARIRWADIDPRTGALDVDDVRQLISQNTKAVIVYHLAGFPGPARELATLCGEAGIKLIEDCNNALGATRDGRPIGNDGDYAIYSFYPNRQVNGLEGGAIACRSSVDAERAARLRRFGIDAARFRDKAGEIADNVDIVEIGWSASMSNLNSAVALAQIEALEDRLEAIRANARRLTQLFVSLDDAQLMEPISGASPTYWGFLLRCAKRDSLLTRLKDAGIHGGKLHQRNDQYSGMPAYRRDLPGVDALERSMLAIPCGWWLGEQELSRIEEVIAVALR